MFRRVKEFLHRFIYATGNQIDEITTMTSNSRDDYLFQEGGRSILVYAELLPGNARLIDASSLSLKKSWLPPHEKEPFTEEDKKRVLDKVCKYFDRSGTPYEIV